MQELYGKLRRADCIVLGTPAYFWQETAQTKTFIDRLYAFYDENLRIRLKDRKRGALVFVWGEPGKAAARTLRPIVKYLEKILSRVLKVDLVGSIVVGGLPESGDASSNVQLVKDAWALGKEMAHSLHR